MLGAIAVIRQQRFNLKRSWQKISNMDCQFNLVQIAQTPIKRHVKTMSKATPYEPVLEVLVLEGLLIDYVDVETIGTYISHIKNNQLIVAQIIEQCIK